MKLDYFTLLCPEPISLSVGTIRQPTLRDIGKLNIMKFGLYQVYLKLTPRYYYKYINVEHGELYWDTLSEEEQHSVTLYDVVLVEESLQNIYVEIFNFFFIERVIFKDGYFLIINTNDYDTDSDDLELTKENIRGVINRNSLMDVLDVIQQVCCIKSKDPLDEPKPKFKNKKAKRMYERMLKAKEDELKKQEKKDFYNLSLANIISSTASQSTGLNIINIWNATLFQLHDQFDKTQNSNAYYMNSVRVAVWGDEKDQFDPSLWYKNNYDTQL